MYRSGLLLGRDHTELGEYEVLEIAPNLAIGISRGRFPKGYPSTERNEDAVFAGTDGTTTVMAVADGHRGAAASHEAIDVIADVTESSIRDESLMKRLLHAVTGLASDESGTALSICVASSAKADVVQFGDTSFLRADGGAVEIVEGKATFLSRGAEPETLTANIGSSDLLSLVSDGVTAFADLKPIAAHAVSESGAPAAFVKQMISEAFRGGAGDNIAIAALSHRIG